MKKFNKGDLVCYQRNGDNIVGVVLDLRPVPCMVHSEDVWIVNWIVGHPAGHSTHFDHVCTRDLDLMTDVLE